MPRRSRATRALSHMIRPTFDGPARHGSEAAAAAREPTAESGSMIDWCPAMETGADGEGASRTERRLLALALVGEVEARRETAPARSRRAADVARAVARRVGWGERACALLHEAALLQDVGYAAVPGEVLATGRPLGAAERATLALHPVFGAELLRGVLGPEQ